MPKVATKFTADVTVKVGRQSLNIKIPLDLADLDGEKLEDDVLGAAKDKLDEELTLSVANFADLKRARGGSDDRTLALSLECRETRHKELSRNPGRTQ